MSSETSVPSGYVQVASGMTVPEANRFEQQARTSPPLRYKLITTQAGPRGWLDAYVDIWVHPGDLASANTILHPGSTS